ncbi:ribosomal RNA small subunit methyltransferase C [Thalassotalea insulae]|uniref:Ribosomal RNA small subunit methyltransferase C n=1 Tax=Thalassotalea insulae TaxID=2056778 RepID=A0ABQ6GRY9_9GAMM|nr:methyltransferase [Thalassotalea insulae]GLX77949.1 ribosomal RNA small subunit methyltransferase C [Thalassotalea insulae]
MHLANLSQVLQRNEELLSSKRPLLVNMPDDDLAALIKQQNPDCQLSFYDTNYQYHLAHRKFGDSHCSYNAHYQSTEKHDLVIISFPKSKPELLFTLAMLNQCITAQNRLLIVGENKSGIKSLNKLIDSLSHFCHKVDAARHCLLFEASLRLSQAPFNLDDWYSYYQVNLAGRQFKVAALPGVFSQKSLDIGTKVLLEHLPKTIEGKVLDFGCGAGVIATFIGLNHPDASLTLADVSALALASSEKTLEINGLHGQTLATNSLSHIKDNYQFVISNPPFHQGVKTCYAATEQFLAKIKHQLTPAGSLVIVANSFLQYQPIIEQAFGSFEIICTKQGFSVYQAKR